MQNLQKEQCQNHRVFIRLFNVFPEIMFFEVAHGLNQLQKRAFRVDETSVYANSLFRIMGFGENMIQNHCVFMRFSNFHRFRCRVGEVRYKNIDFSYVFY